jgi:hypothetical protein
MERTFRNEAEMSNHCPFDALNYEPSLEDELARKKSHGVSRIGITTGLLMHVSSRSF